MKNEKIEEFAARHAQNAAFGPIKEATCGNSYVRRFKGVETMYCRRSSTTCESTRRRGMCPSN